MAERPWPRAIRFCGAPPSLARASATGRTGKTALYSLLSLPLYMVEELPRILDESA